MIQLFKATRMKTEGKELSKTLRRLSNWIIFNISKCKAMNMGNGEIESFLHI